MTYCEACLCERIALPLDVSRHIKTIGVLTICEPKPLLEMDEGQANTGGWVKRTLPSILLETY